MQRLVCVAAAAPALAVVLTAQSPAAPAIPRTWDETRLATLELPNAATGAPAKPMPASHYEAIPPAVIYRTYPVYRPDREPPGYFDRLREAEPVVAFAEGELRTDADWIAAGERVFHWPIAWRESTAASRAEFAARWAEQPVPTTADGVIPYYVYVVRERGKVEVGTQSCAMCHTRVMADGTAVVGAQGNLPFDHQFAREVAGMPPPAVAGTLQVLFGMPAVAGVAPPYPADADAARTAAALRAIPPGVLARHGSSPFAPVQVPDLIGIRERRYLDRTGLVRHRDIGDLMRYAALNQGLDLLSDWRGFVPQLAAIDATPADQWPADAPPRELLRQQLLDPQQGFRYSDAQLYALARFLYALPPPPNPHPRDGAAQRGAEVFEAAGCAKCHPAPLYTSNELVPVEGFVVPESLRATEAIRSRGVGTDPTLALTTRRGTGFYKVPSLRGVWYRGPFSHDGSVATLEDWFDPRRLAADYLPTGWNPGGKPRAVPGHEFGLDLAPDERRELLAFLRTL